ncbi:methylmalonyl Co-A mutase-associated GTPase MeaB [Fluviicola sp.]|jgi:LAO/AO transport system kinase|uniref:methylmalonyl Co-A mutase-associated GTPase MeaB n=1 Tax=Fluviicola sp. TaxID=1917219 RepID=UPI002839E450|nr:methylmalonyl Co-A mutase-associated GTPase MeaB [Fluviicola sp.]MDR0802264.1 methylmalonyl Co-A mutase-associated GTPase MeaB [Fluviicola sp.]
MNEKRLKEWLSSRKKVRENRTPGVLFDAIRKGDRVALSGAITLLESTREKDQETARELILCCLPFSGNAIRIGITGVPGVGKSSFIEKFGKTILESRGKVAVLAIDPSSERTGGSILGDKTRMETLSQNERVFIRPSAAGSTLGGVARKTRETIILCEAAGFDVILIETVGVGQSEIMVHSMVDFFLLLLLAGAGDELQGIKRGIMEMADGLVVTKSDGDNIQKAKLASRELKNAIHLFPPTSNGWIPEALTCSSLEETGIDEVWEMIGRFEQYTRLNGSFDTKRKHQDLNWMHETLKDLLLQGLWFQEKIRDFIGAKESEVENGNISAFQAAEEIYHLYRNINQ